jgi:hypothetical protein
MDAEAQQQSTKPHAADLQQQLRRVRRAGGQDHVTAG